MLGKNSRKSRVWGNISTGMLALDIVIFCLISDKNPVKPYMLDFVRKSKTLR